METQTKEKDEENCLICNSNNVLKIKCKITCQNCGYKRDCSDP